LSLHEQIYQLSRNDKKNQGGRILCTMLQGIGAPAVNQVIEREEVSQALRYCSEQWTSV
jgi:3-dehydroquinate synthetase